MSVSIASKCVCGKQISGICNGKGDCNSKRVLSDFLNEHRCSDEEAEQLYKYLHAIRIMPHLDELKKIQLTLKNIQF